MNKLSIVGSAGRQEDASKLSRQLFDDMVSRTSHVIQDWKLDPAHVVLVSGGSAFADHVAVRLFLAGKFASLELHLPCEWDSKKQRFNESDPAGHTLNQLHMAFSKAVGLDSLSDLAKAHAAGAKFIAWPGFHARNTQVAKSSNLIAFTFASGKQPKSGSGTLDTWNKCVGRKIHCPLVATRKRKRSNSQPTIRSFLTV